MGTELLAAGVALDVCLEELNVSQPDLITKVHESYVDAGSQLLETNTFGFALGGLPLRNTSKIAQPPFAPVIFQRGKPPAWRVERHDHEQPHAIDAK